MEFIAVLSEPGTLRIAAIHGCTSMQVNHAIAVFQKYGRERYCVRMMHAKESNLKRMDNIGIVVESLDEAISFFTELGLTLEGRAMIEGAWAGRVTGLGEQQVEIAMMVTPDGHSRLELSRFITPPTVADHRNAPVNALGYLRAMFTVEDIDETLERLSAHGAQRVGEVVQYKNAYRLCYIRGPEGLLIGLAEELAGVE
jgi:catechol 2,3-dioxygenase-like lactoylglutathione lyase family enzyme